MGMMINRRRAYGGKKGLLPSGYKQLEYIENTSNAYIDTGVYIGVNNQNFGGISLEYALMNRESTHDGQITSVTPWLFGCFTNDYNSILYSPTLTKNPNVSRLIFRGDTVTMNISPSNINQFYALQIEKGMVMVDLVEVGSYNITGTQSSSIPITLFALNQNDKMYTKMKVKKCIIYNLTNTLIRNFIPCKDANNVVGMYDTVNGVFYSSPNGTAFIAGSEV